MLKAFIHVRLFTSGTAPKGQAKMIPDKKGKVIDALRGEENLLLIAHRSRNLPVILPIPETDDNGDVIILPIPETNENGGNNVTASEISEIIASAIDADLFCRSRPPTSFLSDAEWITLIRRNIRGVYNAEEINVDQIQKDRADQFGFILVGRLENHIVRKIHDKTKHDHWTMRFVRDNLTRYAAMVVYFGHAIRNVSNADEEKCLLRNPSKSWVLVSDAALEGCYLYFDTDSGNWIRSGKAVGSNQSTPRAGLLNRGRGAYGSGKEIRCDR